MVEIHRLLCNSLLFDWPQGPQPGNVMDETTLLALQLRSDNLRDDLTMLCGDLNKNGYDFTDTIRPLLTDAGPASPDLAQRLTAQVKSLQERLKLTHESREAISRCYKTRCEYGNRNKKKETGMPCGR